MNNLQNNAIVRFIFRISEDPITIGITVGLWSVPLQYWLHKGFEDKIQNDYFLLQNFIEWFGVPYGLLLALVLVYIWTQFDNLELEFDREADAVFSLYVTLSMVVNPSLTGYKDEIIILIKSYVSHVLQNYSTEWMESERKTKLLGYDILRNIRSYIGDLVHGNENEVITSELLSLVNELHDVRGDRISRSKQRIRKSMLILAIASSILWLIPFITLVFHNFILGNILTGGTTLIVVALLQIIYDLDEPFGGTWAVDMESWSELSNRI